MKASSSASRVRAGPAAVLLVWLGSAMLMRVQAEEGVEPPAVSDCPDLTGDGIVNVPDLLQLLSYFGCEGAACCAGCDTNQDGRANVLDILRLLSWYNVRYGHVTQHPCSRTLGGIVAPPSTPTPA